MLAIAQGQAGQVQAQLIGLGAELHRTAEEFLVARRIGGGRVFDFDFHGAQRLVDNAAQLADPAGQHRVHHEAVVGVVRADRVEAQPGAAGILHELRLAAVILCVELLEVDQRTRGGTQIGRLCGGNARQTELVGAAELTHAQTEGGVAAELDRGVAEAHVARNGQAPVGFGEARVVQPVLFEQRLRGSAARLQCIGQTVYEAYRNVAKAYARPAHGATARD
ncbi:hypothetical protein D9M71_220770 [compost metagenome]